MRYIITVMLLVASININNVFAATYYVKPDGSDIANGLSNATAWKSVGKVNRFSFKTGDDVYFMSGGSWKKQLVIDWNGTSTNPVIIGSYYVNNGAEVIGIKNGSKRPTFIGGYPLLNVKGAIPASNWGAMVHVKANYVTVKDLRVEKSSGSGIALQRARHHAIFENNEVDVTAGSSIVFYRRTHSNIMRNNSMRQCAKSWKDGTWVIKPHPICNGAVGSRNNLIENNLVTASYGEGIVAFAPGANNNIIRGNTVVVARSVGIYIDNGANNIVENNLVVGDSSSKYKKAAFALNVEDYKRMRSATGNIFRNNLAANTRECFWMGMEPDAISKDLKLGGKFIGNTCIGMEGSIKYFDTEKELEIFQVSNNIFYNMEEDVCKFPSTSKVRFANNLWQTKPKNRVCQSDGDIIGDPGIASSFRWSKISPDFIPEVNDFIPQPGSSVYGAGLPMDSMTKDYYGSLRPSKPSIGAIDVSGSITSVIRPN